MATLQKILFFLLTLSLLLTACGRAAPTPALGVAGQPTLVFIFTDP